MELLVFILCVTPWVVTSITISPNGNSPEVKMLGGMMVEKGFVPMTTTEPDITTEKNNYDKSRKLNYNSTKLSINERYRRLIPYMTFYYANDLTAPPPKEYSKNVEVEKAQIIEAPMDRQPKKIIQSPYRNIPRYQGNRIPQYPNRENTNNLYDDIPTYQEPIRSSPQYNPLITDPYSENHNYRKIVFKPNKAPSAPFSMPSRKPYLNHYPGNDHENRYYLTEKNPAPKYKLVPYEQTAPVKVHQQELYVPKKPIPVPVQVNPEPVYLKQRPVRPQFLYDNVYIQPARKPSMTVSESYYENLRPQHQRHSAIENGFKPILSNAVPVTVTPLPLYENSEVMAETATTPSPILNSPNYYQYFVEEPVYTQSTVAPNTMSIGSLVNSLQINKSIPKPITRDNVGTSIRTLLQVLSALKGAPDQKEVDSLVLSTPQPYVTSKDMQDEETKPVVEPAETPLEENVEFHQEPYLAPVIPPSQHIDEYPTHSSSGGSSQQFPLRINSADDGGTPGRPGEDYPILDVIPETRFDCKTQRYKGFFADPETRCQVWHYCDLNGGQASFLCPNGTIFSQAGLTCDWWFNVRCDSTAQLYVLNESLYKFILPHSPKFPEDYSGPLVDKYLTLKFKEMEEQFQKNKKSKQSEKSDSEEDSGSEEASTDANEVSESSDDSTETDVTSAASVSEASVVVESSGASGNVQRLQDEK